MMTSKKITETGSFINETNVDRTASTKLERGGFCMVANHSFKEGFVYKISRTDMGDWRLPFTIWSKKFKIIYSKKWTCHCPVITLIT